VLFPVTHFRRETGKKPPVSSTEPESSRHTAALIPHRCDTAPVFSPTADTPLRLSWTARGHRYVFLLPVKTGRTIFGQKLS